MITDFSKTLDKIPPSGIRKFFDLVIGAKDIISLGVGEPDFVTPSRIIDAATQCFEEGITSYTSNKGLLDCRVKVAQYLEERYSCKYNPEDEIIITSGVSEGVDIVFRSILNPGDEVVLPDPNYVCYEPLITLAGGVVKSLDTVQSNFIPDPEKIEALMSKKTKAILLCSPSNPTGMVIPKPILKKIADIAKRYDCWVISDEIYSEIIYDEEFVSIASLPGMKKRTILLSGFSKSFAMTGWRLGYLCAPKGCTERALKIHQYSSLCAPVFSQYAAIEALDKCLTDVEMMRKSYLFRRNMFVNGLNKIGLKTIMPQGAFYTFSSITFSGLNSEDFATKLLKEEKVAVVPGIVFGDAGRGYIRCCYATSIDELKEALIRLERFIKQFN